MTKVVIRNLFLVFLGLGSLSTIAQTNFRPGVIVVEGDSLHGLIDHREWSQNPKTISFKKAEGADVVQYKASVIRYLLIEGEEFIQYNGPISMDKNSMRPADVLKLKTVTDTVLMKILARGKRVSLFSYRDAIKNRFYLATGDAKPEELIYRTYPDEGNNASTFVVDDRYKSQLIYAAQATGDVSSSLRFRISKSTYGTKSLSAIVDEINGSTKIPTSGTKAPIDLFVGGGLNRAQLHFPSDLGWSTSSQTSYSGYGSVGVDLFANPAVRRMVIRGELSFGIASLRLRADSVTNTTIKHIDYSSMQYTTTLGIQVMYNLYNASSLKVYVGAGLKFNLSSYTNHNFTITEDGSDEVLELPTGFEYIPLWTSLNFQAGVLLNRRFEIMACYSPQVGRFTASYEVLGQSISYTRVGVNYHFNLK